MILHILTQSPSSEAFSQCLSAVTKNDAVLLIQDGIYAETDTDLAATGIKNIFALTADRQARGLNTTPEAISLIDYNDFVALTLEYDKTVTW